MDECGWDMPYGPVCLLCIVKSCGFGHPCLQDKNLVLCPLEFPAPKGQSFEMLFLVSRIPQISALVNAGLYSILETAGTAFFEKFAFLSNENSQNSCKRMSSQTYYCFVSC